MNKFARSLITEWRRLELPTAGETILIAVSGGADSASLALALAELRRAKKFSHEFVVAHFNHDLRGAESERDAAFVEDLAKRLEFEFTSAKPEKSLINQKDNLEQAARRARYEFLKSEAEKRGSFAVLTAHTLNDQAETFLLNLVRGSGAGGLGAMKGVRLLNESGKILLVRPFLNWATREMTEEFCRANEIEFRLDQMNEDLNFARVRVRKNLLPLLREFNPKIVETLAQTAKLLREEADAFEEICRDLPSQSETELSLKRLKNFPEPVRRRILRGWLRQRRGDLQRLGMKHLEAVERLIVSEKSGREVEMPDGGKVVKTGGKLAFKNSKVEKSPPAD